MCTQSAVEMVRGTVSRVFPLMALIALGTVFHSASGGSPVPCDFFSPEKWTEHHKQNDLYFVLVSFLQEVLLSRGFWGGKPPQKGILNSKKQKYQGPVDGGF